MDYPDCLPSTQMLDCTQALEEGEEEEEENKNRILGTLVVGDDTHNITRGRFKIGRDPEQCDIVINNQHLSKIHVTIEAEADWVTVQDERSSNGTKKGKMSLKPGVMYNLEDGESLCLGGAVLAKFRVPERAQEEDDDVSSTASETLLKDLEDDAENVPPNFVPETPQTVKPTPFIRGKPALPDQSFLPESQSSPLPSSLSAILKPSVFQIPESPSSDLNDSSFIVSSQQSTGIGRTNIRGKSSSTTEPLPSLVDTFDSEEIAEPPKLERVDTNKLNNLIAAVRKDKEKDDDFLCPETEDDETDCENDDSTANILDVETQIVGEAQPVAAGHRIQSKLSNSQIIGASTQFLVSKLEESFDSDSLIDSEDDELLAKETQPVFSNLGLGSNEESSFDTEADTVIVASSDDDERNGTVSKEKWYAKIGDNIEAGSSASSEDPWSEPMSWLDDKRKASSSVDSPKLDGTTTVSVSMIEASQPAEMARVGTVGRNKTDVNSVTMDQTVPLDSEILVNDSSDQTEPSPGGNRSLNLQLDATIESPLNNKKNDSPNVSSVKEGETKNPNVSLYGGRKIKVTRRSSVNLTKKQSVQTNPPRILSISLTPSPPTPPVSVTEHVDSLDESLPLTQELTIEDEKIENYSDEEDFNEIDDDPMMPSSEFNEAEPPVEESKNEISVPKPEESNVELSVQKPEESIDDISVEKPEESNDETSVQEPKESNDEISVQEPEESKKPEETNSNKITAENREEEPHIDEQTKDSSIADPVESSKTSRKTRAKKVLNPEEWEVQTKRKTVERKNNRQEADTETNISGNKKRKSRAAQTEKPQSKSKEKKSTINDEDENQNRKGKGKIGKRSVLPKVSVADETEVTEAKADAPVARRGRGRPRKSEPVTTTSVSEVQEVQTVKEKKKPESSEAEPASSAKTRGRKRTADLTPEMETARKRRAVDSSGSSCGSTRSRRLGSISEGCGSPTLRKLETRAKKFSVMFTGTGVSSTDKELISQLQGSITESVRDCNVLVTDKIRRTAKFLSMVAKGVPIVSASWLVESRKFSRFLEPWDFILNDRDNEKKWGFKLEETLKKAKTERLLEGLYIHVTASVQPSPEMCQEIIECGGGTFIKNLPKAASPDLYVVSTKEDRKQADPLAKSGVPVMDKEWLLSGLLKYKLDRKLKL